MSIEDVLTTKKCFACDPENGGDVDVFLKKSATGKVLTKGKAEIFIVFVQRVKWRFDAPPA